MQLFQIFGNSLIFMFSGVKKLVEGEVKTARPTGFFADFSTNLSRFYTRGGMAQCPDFTLVFICKKYQHALSLFLFNI